MKKLLLTIIFALVTNICFAEDLYVVTENGFAKYLRTETASAKIIPKTGQESLFEMTYTLICIPDKPTLEKIRNQTFDQKINYEKQLFTFKCSFLTSNNQWLQDGSLWINSDEFWSYTPEKCLYESHGVLPVGAYYGDSPEAMFHRSIVLAAYNYVVSHNLINY